MKTVSLNFSKIPAPRMAGLRIGLAMLMCCAVFDAQAAGSVDEHRPLDADGRVYLNNVAGTIVVSTWDKNEIYLRGELGREIDGVDISGVPSNLSIIVKVPKKSHVSGDADLSLTVPIGARVELESVSADITAQDLRGPVKINTVSGSAQLQLASPDVSVQTVSGDINLRGPSHATFAKTVSGDVHLAGMQGKLAVETVSGNVQLDGGRFNELRLKSVSGDMHLDVTLAQVSQIVGDTLSGEITLDVPADVTGTALLKSFSGDTSCDARMVATSTPASSPDSGSSSAPGRNGRHEYIWGDGSGARVELSSFSGDIQVVRKAAHGSQTPPPFVGKD